MVVVVRVSLSYSFSVSCHFCWGSFMVGRHKKTNSVGVTNAAWLVRVVPMTTGLSFSVGNLPKLDSLASWNGWGFFGRDPKLIWRYKRTSTTIESLGRLRLHDSSFSSLRAFPCIVFYAHPTIHSTSARTQHFSPQTFVAHLPLYRLR